MRGVNIRIRINGFIAAVLLAVLGVHQACAVTRHTLIVGIGGCRPDALQIANAPCMQGLAASGTFSWASFAGGLPGWSQQATLSGPSWSSALTGVWSNRHHVADDTFTGYSASNAPHFFSRIKSVAPAAYLSSIVEWAPIDTSLVGGAGTNCDFHQTAINGQTSDLVSKATNHLATASPDVLFLEFEAVENAGRASGFSPTNSAYLGAISQVDSGLATILGAIRSRSAYSSEEWLVMVLSDHGGTNKTTGGQSSSERTTFMILNGPGITPGRTLTPGSGLTCVPPTVMVWMNLPMNISWYFDSPIFGLSVTNYLEVYLNLDNTLSASAGTSHTAVPYGPQPPHYTNGIVGTAAAFTNLDPGVTARTNNDWAATLGNIDWIYANDFTIGMWFMSPNPIGSGGAFCGNKDWISGTNQGWVVSPYTLDEVNWDTNIGDRHDVNLQSAFRDGKWHHLVVVFAKAGNRVMTYLDGQCTATNLLDGVAGHDGHAASLAAGFGTLIGASGPQAPTFGITGWLDEFAIWRRALDGGEINELFIRGGLGQSLTNALWPKPQFLAQPASTNVEYGAPVTLGLSYTGLYANCQWLFNGQAIPKATNTSFFIPLTQAMHAGNYSAIVANNGGAITTAVAALGVNPRPYSALTSGLAVHLALDGNLNPAPGTTVSGSVYTGMPRYVSGVIGQGSTFTNNFSAPGPSDWAVSLGNLEAIYSNSFTVALWVRTVRSTDDAFIGNKNWSKGDNQGWIISAYSGENVNFTATGGTRRDYSLPLNDGVWHHVVFTFNRNTNQACAYLDGVLTTNSTISATGLGSLNAGYPTLIGASGPGTYGATADIDDLAIWTRVLTTGEVRSAYLNGRLEGLPLQTQLSLTNLSVTSHQVVMGWPLTGFYLQTTTNLNGGWSNVVPATATTNAALVPISNDSQRFFRLSN